MSRFGMGHLLVLRSVHPTPPPAGVALVAARNRLPLKQRAARLLPTRPFAARIFDFCRRKRRVGLPPFTTVNPGRCGHLPHRLLGTKQRGNCEMLRARIPAIAENSCRAEACFHFPSSAPECRQKRGTDTDCLDCGRLDGTAVKEGWGKGAAGICALSFARFLAGQCRLSGLACAFARICVTSLCTFGSRLLLFF